MDFNFALFTSQTQDNAYDSYYIENQNNSSLDVPIVLNNNVNESFCSYCNIPMKIYYENYVCESCGVEKELFNTEPVESEDKPEFISNPTFSYTGKNAHIYRKSIIKFCSDYSTISYQTVKREILNCIESYEGNKPPMDVRLACIDLYFSIKENGHKYLEHINARTNKKDKQKKRLVFRSNGKKGLFAACLYYACIEKGLTRTPREISDIMGVDKKYQSAADKRMQEFYELGIINLPIQNKILDDYLNRYFPLLNINDKYKQFIIDLIERAKKKYLNINNECRISTKCIGAIYLLCTRIPEYRNITKDTISRECSISKTTFLKYYTILNNPIMKKTFRKHHIPMPESWRKFHRKQRKIMKPINP